MTEGLSFRLLGPLTVWRAGNPLAIGGRKQRSVLAVLLLAPGTSVPVSRLVDDVWNENPPPSAPSTLYAYVSRLKRFLGDDLRRDDGGYRCDVVDESVDLRRFELLVAAGDASLSKGDDRAAAAAYGCALEEWSGDTFLGELGTEPFAQLPGSRAAALRLHATTHRFDALLRMEEAGDLIPELEEAVARHPYVEPLWAQLMLALYRSGRQVDAIRTFGRAACVLREDVGVEPGAELRRLERRILDQDPGLAARARDAARREAAAARTNLRVAGTSFVGRDAAIDDAMRAIDEHQLVTLIGPGGVGKTRLAVETAWQLVDRRSLRIWEIDLTAVSRDDDVVPVVAESLGVPVRAGPSGLRRLTHHFADEAALLLLDNCEHVVGGVSSLVGHLLEHAPDVRILATSRVPLFVAGEHRIVVPPLDATGAGAPAVELFLERARLVASGQRTADNIARIVHRLEGFPLSIELAAAATALLTTSQLADELDRRTLGLVDREASDARHSTLHDTIAWSYDLLDAPEQRLLMHLSVFPAPFTTADAAAICGDSSMDAELSMRPRLAHLVDRSLVVAVDPADSDDSIADGAPAPRWRLFEIVREYVAERAASAGMADILSSRHTAHYTTVAAETAMGLHGSDAGRAVARLRSDHHHLTAMLRTLEGRALALTVRNLWYWWYLDGFIDEASNWLAAAVQASAPDDALTAELLAASALVASDSGDVDWIDHAAAAGERAIELATPLGDDVLAGVHLLYGDALTAARGHFSYAESLLVSCRDHFLTVGSEGRAGWAELRLVRVDGFLRGDLAGGRARLARAVDLLEQAGDVQLLAYAEMIRANMARMHGDVATGIEHAAEALALYRRLGARTSVADALDIQIDLLLDAGRLDAAEAAIDELDRLVTNRSLVSWRPTVELRRGRCLVARGDHHRARIVFEGELHDRRQAHDAVSVQTILQQLAPLVALAGDHERALILVGELDALSAATPSPWSRLAAHRVAGDVALILGRHAAAAGHLRETLAEAKQLTQRSAAAEALEGLSVIHRASGSAGDCAEVLGAARRIRDDCGAEPGTRLATRTAAVLQWCRAQLTASEFDLRWRAGADAGLDVLP